MREIEVKAKLKDKNNLILKAKEMGIFFAPPFTQDDTTYETTLSKSNTDWNIFRIRKQSGKLILTMKYKASSRSRDNHERESEISNAKEVADMLERVGYSKGVRIKKTRQVAHYNNFEICIDEIEKLGSFIEVEALASDNADVDKVQNKLWALLEQLGIHPNDRIHKGYDILMHEFLNS